MKKRATGLALILILGFLVNASSAIQQDERLFQAAKILIFDKEWEAAQEKLEELLENYPDSPWYSQALFYKGKCLKEQKGNEREALAVYTSYLLRKDRNESLAEESEIAIIDLAFDLYEKGKKSYLDEIVRRMRRRNRYIKYYAAVKLSYLKDKKAARKGLPVLREILEEEKDEELRDRAKIALLRIDPDALRDIEEEPYKRKAKTLHIRVTHRWKKGSEMSINIPWALADLALSSIPDEDRAEIRKEGYNLDEIIRELTEYKGKIIEIKTESSIIKLWID